MKRVLHMRREWRGWKRPWSMHEKGCGGGEYILEHKEGWEVVCVELFPAHTMVHMHLQTLVIHTPGHDRSLPTHTTKPSSCSRTCLICSLYSVLTHTLPPNLQDICPPPPLPPHTHHVHLKTLVMLQDTSTPYTHHLPTFRTRSLPSLPLHTHLQTLVDVFVHPLQDAFAPLYINFIAALGFRILGSL